MKVSIIIKCIKMDKILGLNNINARGASKRRNELVEEMHLVMEHTLGRVGKGKARTGSRNGLKVFGLRQLIMRTPK